MLGPAAHTKTPAPMNGCALEPPSPHCGCALATQCEAAAPSCSHCPLMAWTAQLWEMSCPTVLVQSVMVSLPACPSLDADILDMGVPYCSSDSSGSKYFLITMFSLDFVFDRVEELAAFAVATSPWSGFVRRVARKVYPEVYWWKEAWYMLGCCLWQGGGCVKTQSVSTPLLSFAVSVTEMEAAFAFPLVGQHHAWGKQRLDSRSRVALWCKPVVLKSRSPCLTRPFTPSRLRSTCFPRALTTRSFERSLLCGGALC